MTQKLYMIWLNNEQDMPCQSEEGQCFQKNFAHTICDIWANNLNPKIKYFSSYKQIVQNSSVHITYHVTFKCN